MSTKINKCPHLDNILQLSLSELCKLKQGSACTECKASGPNVWICLHKNCLHTGCSEQYNDHSTKHFHSYPSHCIHMNLSSQRTWCYLCEAEVFLNQNQRRISIVSNDSSDNSSSRYSERVVIYDRGGGESCDSSGEDEDGNRNYMGGLVGLQNIANTCYMNAALQALSNTPALTGYFLHCDAIIETMAELTQNQRKYGLARNYHKLVKEMWCKNRRHNGYVVPSGILSCIRNVHPMFRGFQQHDTQEFLRCFMDQLHEELKEITPPPPDILVNLNNNEQDEDSSPCSSPSPSQSEAEYETCDSGVSEQSSLSDEGCIRGRRENRFARSASPSNQRNLSKNHRSNSGTSLNSQKDQQTKLPHRSIISDVFDGKLLSAVQCLTCDRVSTREETFQDLSLPIPGKDHLAVIHQNHGLTTQPIVTPQQNGVTCTDAVYRASQEGWIWWFWNWFKSWLWGPAVTLHDCMSAFFSADELKGDNMYSCEKCNKLRNGVKFSRVLALPEMLCVHLKRFRHDLSYSSKISSPVIFPLTGLDMRPYLHKDCKSEISTYDLTAVICHHGTVGGGHYTSYAKHEATKKWFEFDDQLVTEVPPEAVENCEAYVLFYRKSNPQMPLLRAEVARLSESILQQASDIRFFVSRQWLNRFYTFAEPGPIDNWALLCPHGGLPPCKADVMSRLVFPLPQPVWDYLYNKFGGGPACNHLFECVNCRRAAETLSNRQANELNTFAVYNDEFQLQENPTTIYAISMAWFRQWQLFARGNTTDEPGPINNVGIAAPSETVPIRSVRKGSDYAQINTTLWKFFHGIYGGGPEIILGGGPSEDKSIKNEKDMEQIMDQDELIEPQLAKSSNISIHSKSQPQPKSNNSVIISNNSSNSSAVVIPNNNSQTITNQSIIPNLTSFTSQQNNSTGKIPKNVSFEIDDQGIGSSEVTSDNSSSKRSKKENPTQNFNNDATRKDKKLRGMKTAGFFGAEGKYQDYKIVDSDVLKESSKKLDEIMPLLHQTTISAHDESNKKINTQTNTRREKTTKNMNRKKFKTKSLRKSTASVSLQNNDSDSA